MAHFLDGPGPCLLHRCPTALIRVSCSSQLTAALSVVSSPPSSYQPHNPQALCNLYRSTLTVDTLNVPRSMVCNVCWWSRLRIHARGQLGDYFFPRMSKFRQSLGVAVSETLFIMRLLGAGHTVTSTGASQRSHRLMPSGCGALGRQAPSRSSPTPHPTRVPPTRVSRLSSLLSRHAVKTLLARSYTASTSVSVASAAFYITPGKHDATLRLLSL